MTNYRFDYFLTRYFFHPLIKRYSYHNALRIPILMYHSISDEIENKAHPYYGINTSLNRFREHIKYLHDNDYSVVNLTNILNVFDLRKKATSKYVILTFDDGFQDFYSNAFPILNKYHFTATVFLPTGLIENQNLKLRGKDHLNWQEIRELSKNGVVFGSHSVTHQHLDFMTKNDIEYEIKKSKEMIEDKIGKSVHSFSYPLRFPEEQKNHTKYLKAVLEKYFYLNGVTTRIGLARKDDDIHFLRRIPLNSYDDLPFFKAKLEGGYDWLYRPQYVYKLLKSKIQIK
jgi:peptidoglycan/xylan/chitin deacetylase (PgdA/CDA1 family)